MRQFIALIPISVISLFGTSANAEGTAQLNTTQALRSGTQLYVDVLHPDTESIGWIGVGQVAITGPNGATVGTLSSGQTLVVAGGAAGAYGVRVIDGQVVGIAWDVEVVGQVEPGGRLFSYDWKFNAGSFSSTRATYASFYSVVPGGQPDADAVIELKLDGLAGYVYNVSANRIGVDGPDAGRSVAMYGHTVTPEFPIYLLPPTAASYNPVNPSVFGLNYIGGVSEDVSQAPIEPCNQVVPGQSYGRFQFYTDVEGTYHLQCDLDGDGQYESSNDDDLLVIGTSSAGVNTVLWNGTHQGTEVPFGTYDCRVRVNIGEFHYVGSDIETSYQGMRMYEVASDSSRSSLGMHWNDSAVQPAANTMLSGQLGLANSGQEGLLSGDYAAPAVANINSRSWGNFTSSGKGNQNYLDTYTWLSSATSTVIELRAVDSTLDDDGDGLSNFEEECFYGTDPTNPDSDGDGVSDGAQYAPGSSSGGVGGLESNGRMAEQLARRTVARARLTSEARYGPRWSATSAAADDTNMVRFLAVLNTLELPGYYRVESTPSDLLYLTNASDVYAVDYIDEAGQIAGSILVVETLGDLYEHTKAVCDRAGGATLLSAGTIGEHSLVGASYRDAIRQTLDRSIEFKLYEEDSQRMSLESHWLRQQYSQARLEQSVLNVQVWGRRLDLSSTIANGITQSLQNADILLAPLLTVLDETTVESWSASPVPTFNSPTIVITEAELLGSNLDLAVDRFAGEGSNSVLLQIHRVSSDGTSLAPQTVQLDRISTLERMQIDVGLVRDITIDVFDNSLLVDQLWLADGAWALFDDSLWGGDTTIDTFNTNCPVHSLSNSENAVSAELELSGCAYVDSSYVDRFVGVARHLSRGLNTKAYDSVAFWYRSSESIEACVEDTTNGHRICTEFSAASRGRYASLSIKELKHITDRLHLVTVTQSQPGSLEVSGLTFLRVTTTPVTRGCGCDTTESGSRSAMCAMLLTLFFLNRSRRSHHTGLIDSSQR